VSDILQALFRFVIFIIKEILIMANGTVVSAKILETKTVFKTEFEGLVTPFNKGEHKFNAEVPDKEKLDELISKGFQVKKYTNDKDETTYFIPIYVSYRYFIPNVQMILDGVQIPLTEETLKELDGMDIQKCRVQFTLSTFEAYGKIHHRAYLNNGYFYVAKKIVEMEDPFADVVAEELEQLPF
jgi:hypothetical protein